MPEAGFWQSFFDSKAILKKLVQEIPLGRVLEFGSGYGTFSIPLASMGHEVIRLHFTSP